jgi:hypothetical protein
MAALTEAEAPSFTKNVTDHSQRCSSAGDHSLVLLSSAGNRDWYNVVGSLRPKRLIW